MRISLADYAPYTSLSFHQIDRHAKKLADSIEVRFKDLTDILLAYESYEVVHDETARTLDLLRHLRENKKYFRFRIGAVTTFLPRNQPLYAFACFVVVPSLMAREVHFCIPNSMRHFFQRMLDLLDIATLFPNIIVSSKQRLAFLEERSALVTDPHTHESRPLTDVVIFTGKPSNADRLRLIFDKRTLFIANGAGHNPVVVSKDADPAKAVEAVLTLTMYNQGQDCAAPNAILVHKAVVSDFLRILRERVSAVKIGHYKDTACRIGPISDPADLVRIEDFFIEHREWLDPSTPGVIRARDAIVEPTIVCKPLANGGNFSEVFAPIIFVHEYAYDRELKHYFEDHRYAPHAMYVTLYGTSAYVKGLIGKSINGKILHDRSTLIYHTHLHAPGVERGTQPYGGYGYGASSVAINGKIIPQPTLPQRDIYEWVVKPLLRNKAINASNARAAQFTTVQKKDVKKLLRLHASKSSNHHHETQSVGRAYVDLHVMNTNGARFAQVGDQTIFYLLTEPNIDYIAALPPEESAFVRSAKALVHRKSAMAFDAFRSSLYAIPKAPRMTAMQNKTRQRRFFHHMYQLLFGKEHGPQLAAFLWDVDEKTVHTLLAPV